MLYIPFVQQIDIITIRHVKKGTLTPPPFLSFFVSEVGKMEKNKRKRQNLKKTQTQIHVSRTKRAKNPTPSCRGPPFVCHVEYVEHETLHAPPPQPPAAAPNHAKSWTLERVQTELTYELPQEGGGIGRKSKSDMFKRRRKRRRFCLLCFAFL